MEVDMGHRSAEREERIVQAIYEAVKLPWCVGSKSITLVWKAVVWG